MSLEIYLDPCTVNSRRVLAGLDLLGTKYEFHHVDYFAVPCARDGACIVTESNAILQYAADLGTNDSNYTKYLKQRANVNRWLLWESSVWFQSCYIYFVEYAVKPLLNAEPDESIITAEAPKWNKHASILDKQLSMTKWITGDEATIADLAIASPVHFHAVQRLPLDKYPNLKQ